MYWCILRGHALGQDKAPWLSQFWHYRLPATSDPARAVPLNVTDYRGHFFHTHTQCEKVFFSVVICFMRNQLTNKLCNSVTLVHFWSVPSETNYWSYAPRIPGNSTELSELSAMQPIRVTLAFDVTPTSAKILIMTNEFHRQFGL